MRTRRALTGMSLALWLGLASCTVAPQAVVRNATGADMVLWPLSERPLVVKAGEATQPIIYTAHERQEALIECGGCLYTYPAPDYFQLPKSLQLYASRVVVVIHEDMSLSAHQRSKEGLEGAEIVAAGFPLRPTAYCGRRAEG